MPDISAHGVVERDTILLYTTEVVDLEPPAYCTPPAVEIIFLFGELLKIVYHERWNFSSCYFLSRPSYGVIGVLIIMIGAERGTACKGRTAFFAGKRPGTVWAPYLVRTYREGGINGSWLMMRF